MELSKPSPINDSNEKISKPQANEKTKSTEQQITKKREIIPQSTLPHYSLKKSLEVAQALHDQCGSSQTLPHLVAKAVGYSQTSYSWRMLSGSAVAYGLTDGAYKSKGISLTNLATTILKPTYEGQKENALIEAVLKPKIMTDFFKKYDKQKFPQKEFGVNILQTMMGVPADRAERTYEIIKENGMFTGIITDSKTGLFVSIDTGHNSLKKQDDPSESVESSQNPSKERNGLNEKEINQFAASMTKRFDQTTLVDDQAKCISEKPKNTRVFVSHGKNKLIVDQLKEIIQFGKYEPIISVERESTSKPVPEKVLDDMRSCFAGVIVINSDEDLIDQNGHQRKKINDNVLIEIGAALALYYHNNILLVQKGIDLPSNLQGLYRCEFEGETLDMNATIKLLKGFNEFK